MPRRPRKSSGDLEKLLDERRVITAWLERLALAGDDASDAVRSKVREVGWCQERGRRGVLTHQQWRNTFRLRFFGCFELKSRGAIRAQLEVCKETDASG